MLSLEKIRELIVAALDAKYGMTEDGYRRYYLVETFPDYCIVQDQDALLFKLSYSLTSSGELVLGDLSQVETAYVPVQQSARFIVLAAGQADADGWSWPVQVMEAGSANGSMWKAATGESLPLPQEFPVEVVAQVASAINSARFGRRHPVTEEEDQDPGRIAGWFSDGRMEGRAALATLHLLKTETEIRAKLLAARDAGKMDLFNLSVYGIFGFRPQEVAGKKIMRATKLAKLVSVDLCAEPAANGKFLIAASRDALAEISALQLQSVKTSSIPNGEIIGNGRKGTNMKESIFKVLEALRKLDAGRANELTIEFAGLAEAKHGEFLAKLSEALALKSTAAQNPDHQEVLASIKEAQNLMSESLKKAEILKCENLINQKLAESKLPAPAASLVRTHLADRVVKPEEIDGEIAKVREAFAAFSNVGRASGAGVEVGRDTQEKIQLAMDALLGVKEALKDPAVKPFRGIRSAYIEVTGDSTLQFDRGGFFRTSQAIATADFPNLLLNSMTKRAIQDYRELGMGGLDQLFTPQSVSDLKTQDRVRDGYFGDLAVVAEAGPYTEFTKPTDEKISYTLTKYGNLLTISEETIINDDLGKISRFPMKIARAGRRTLKQVITNFFINNPNYDPDGVAWFHATHSNLGSTALSTAELDAREQALMKQTEKDSTKRLGLPLEWIMVPIELKSSAYQINQNDTGTNPWFQRFGAQNERIIVNELLTDANDWFYGSLPASAPFLEIGFLDGVQEPQILLANDTRTGLSLTNDQLVYKVKFRFGGDVIDFRPVGKNVVP